MFFRITTFLVFGLLYTGCSHKLRPMHLIDRADINSTTYETLQYDYKYEPWSQRKSRPDYGLALSGGGSKAAPMAMGVLKWLVDSDNIKKIDIISSVSGGSYSAFYFYNKAYYMESLDQNREKNLKNYFVDARARKHQKGKYIFANSDYNSPEYKAYHYIERNNTKESCENFKVFQTPVRHQRWVRCYQDLLSPEPGGAFIQDKNLRVVSNGLLYIPPYFIPHHIANTLFDWRLELSKLADLYKAGITRTYGYTFGKKKFDSLWDYNRKDINIVNFQDLRAMIHKNQVPLWIINTTHGGNFEYLISRDNSPIENQFELTPFGYGSDQYKYTSDSNITPDVLDINVSRGVLASAAFLDHYSNGDSPLKNLGYFSFLHFFDLKWGITVENYNVDYRKRNIHNFLPFPFYFFDNFFSKRISRFRLADGGMSGDNLGIYPLIKRGTKNIIVVSSGEDKDSEGDLKLKAICTVNRQLAVKGYEILFKGNPDGNKSDKTYLLNNNKEFNFDLSRYCSNSESDKHNKKLFNYRGWKKNIWKGKIFKLHDSQPSENGSLIAGINIFFIKAALDEKKFNDAVKYFCKNKLNCNGMYNSIPCTLIGFWQDNRQKKAFPQHGTVAVTYNSSSSVFSAYADLGYYHAQSLEAIFNDSNGEKKLE